MAVPARLVAEAAGDGYLQIGFKQDGEWMKTDSNGEDAKILLHYPVQGEMMRHKGEPSGTEKKALALTRVLAGANVLLEGWCS